MSSSFVSRTYKHFEEITDPRINRGANYPLMEMIFLTLCATICDANGWADVERYGKAKLDWLRKFFPFEFGIPSHDTLGRAFPVWIPVRSILLFKVGPATLLVP